jgi:hypothetical protein
MEYGHRVDELERYAIAGHHKSGSESRGLCFQATLTLGQEARRLGLEGKVAFVRWRVRRDVNFLEHWAIVLDNARVLDMTAVQVDGNPDPLRSLRSYPANYVRPRQYPVAIVLNVMERHVPEPDRHFSRRLLWGLHWCLFRHDAAKAYHDHLPLAFMDATTELVRRGVTLCTGYLLERAIARLSRILTRMK